MVIGKNDDFWVFTIHIILCKDVVHFYDSITPRVFFVKSHSETIVHREVKNIRQVRFIIRFDGRIVGPWSHKRRLRQPGFANHRKIRIFHPYASCPISHSFLFRIRIGIHADSVKTGIFDPPDAVLDEVITQIFVVLVQIGHHGVEPAFLENIAVVIGGMWIENGSRPEIRFGIFWKLVDPVLRRQIVDPVMFISAVIKNHIHNHFQIFFMHRLNQVFVILVASISSVNFVKIGNRIAVVRKCRHIIFEQRIKPDCCKTKL